MTTKISVEVPNTANYEVLLAFKDRSGESKIVVKAGNRLDVYIYDGKEITSIREIPLNE